ncbi:uncharacterized protein [Amphiura filiformis]|uniref:uncharacterized protein n=1 Tax=Amphiura filiformis TaxID=82378 RepID=UPI003B213AA8
MDADLVVVEDGAENAFVTTFLPDDTKAAYLIGLVSSTNEPDEYIWVDGTVVRNDNRNDRVYTNWQLGEPNEAYEKCVIITTVDYNLDYVRGAWNDVDCNIAHGYICETYATCGRTILLASLSNIISPRYQLTHLGYPNPYPPDLECQWIIIADNNDTLIVARVKRFELENGFDSLTVGNGPVSTMNEIAELTGVVKVRAITSSMSSMWFMLKTDSTGNKFGYRLELEQITVSNDGAYITCPGSYLCDKVHEVNISMCVAIEEVCDGQIGCPGGDDEIKCDIKRCPEECSCAYQGNNLQIYCSKGWSMETINNMARTVNTLKLTNGLISVVEPGLFKGIFALHTLDLSRNNIAKLTSHAFRGLPRLKVLYLSDIRIATIQADTFLDNTELEILVLIRASGTDVPVNVEKGGFRGLNSLKKLYVDDRFLCCHFDSLEECVILKQQPPLFKCGSLMQNIILRVSMWVLGISALIGNIFVVALRVREKKTSAIQVKQSFLISNLAVSDCQMGIYMLILACVDLYYGDEYFVYSDEWRSSKLCKFANFLSLLSSEASVFFITLISIDRFICILFPFGKFKFRGTSTKVVTGIIWAIAFVLGLLPTLQAGPESDFYDLSDVCIGLPLITRPSSYSIQSSDVGGPDSGRSFDLPVADKFKPAWYYSIAIFLVINLVCFLTIFVCYAAMFISVRISSKAAQRNQSQKDDIKIAIKMAAIVGTDFICWMPVIIMGILSQTEAAVIPLEMYTWSVVFILPMNSSLNPYLYTIASRIADMRKNKQARPSVTQTDSTTISNTVISETNI